VGLDQELSGARSALEGGPMGQRREERYILRAPASLSTNYVLALLSKRRRERSRHRPRRRGALIE